MDTSLNSGFKNSFSNYTSKFKTNFFTNSLTLLASAGIIIYVITNLLYILYGVGSEVYGIYVTFFMFIIISIIVLPNNYPEV